MSVWKAQNNGAPAAIGVGAKREDVRFADLDGKEASLKSDTSADEA
jgi:hypothetical protein